jgi:hypothetical protein
MSKFDLIKKLLKNKDNEQKNSIDENKEKTSDENIILKHEETLYSIESSKKSKKTIKKNIQPISEQITWRDIEGIEKKIDKLSKNKIKNSSIDKTLNKKVDNIITKKKKQRKPSNVIYVVSKPQPGQVKGDWAVRSHGKIFSHHRTKENAIKTARVIARKKEATVLVQNTDGTFSEGFKPRTKSK